MIWNIIAGFVKFGRTESWPSSLLNLLPHELSLKSPTTWAAVVAKLARAFAPQAEGWVFESQPWQTLVVKTGSDRSTAKRSALGVSVTGPRRWPLWTDPPCHSRSGTLKNPHCSMAISAEHRSKFAALHRQWWHLQMNKKFSSGFSVSNHKNCKLLYSLTTWSVVLVSNHVISRCRLVLFVQDVRSGSHCTPLFDEYRNGDYLGLTKTVFKSIFIPTFDTEFPGIGEVRIL